MLPEVSTAHLRSSFPELSQAAREAMREYARLLSEVMPMKAAHRRRLPDNIRDLSTFLTTERKELLGRDYLHAPQGLGAYLWYFLPWNMLRLTRLLGGLDFAPREGAVIVDLGAGPLTLIQSLALARPDLLGRELHFYCLDTTPKPMREGRKLYFGLLYLLCEKTNWKTHLIHAPWQAGLRDAPQADVLTAANFMNELPWHRREPLSEQVADFFANVAGHVRDDGQCLFVEPGNRLGGKLVSMLREGAVAQGWNVLAPCTHAKPCPMLGNQRETSWCHFSVSVQGCPDWLAALSREAELPKRDMSLSFAHLTQGQRPSGHRPSGHRPSGQSHSPFAEQAGKRSGERARIISGEFALPGASGASRTGRYACSARGKILLVSEPGEAGTSSGDVVDLKLDGQIGRDAKTQTLMARLHPGKAVQSESLSKKRPKPQKQPDQQQSDLDRPAKQGNKSSAGRKSRA